MAVVAQTKEEEVVVVLTMMAEEVVVGLLEGWMKALIVD